MNESFFLRTFFHSALAIFEPQIYIVVEQFGAEDISLLSGRLVFHLIKGTLCYYFGYESLSLSLIEFSKDIF